MKFATITSFLFFACITTHVSAQELSPFVMPWDDGTKGPTDISNWLHQPAGKFGPVKVGQDGHLYVGDSNIRFFGVNLCFGACFPEKDKSEKIAARMAKFGINCVRFHHMDMRTFPDGIRKPDVSNTRELSPEALDRLDYLIAQLKERGIYVNLNLLVSRPFKAADGLPKEIEQLGWKESHIVGFFYEPIMDLQKEYAYKLLTHRNPYTNTTYADENAVAFVEINNENGLLHSWFGRKIDNMPEVFRKDLQKQWNEWLSHKYYSTEKLRLAWNIRETSLGENILQNSDWQNGMNNWNLEQHNGAKAEISIISGKPNKESSQNVVKIEVSQLGTAGWHVQFNQGKLALEENQPYTVSFWAKSDKASNISVSISQAHDPWGNLGFSRSIEVDQEWKFYKYTFQLKKHDENARLNFSNLANQIGTYYLSGISLQPGGLVGLLKEEMVEDSSVSLFSPTHFEERTTEAQQSWIKFLWETEQNYWQTIYSYLKEELQVQAPIVGTIIGCSTPNLMAELDVVDTHSYWQHPKFPGQPWDSENWLVENVSMVNTKGGGLASISQGRVCGKPHLCTEYNHPAPNTYSSEAPLLLASFGRFQDWDGVFLFSYSHRRDNWDTRKISGFFDIDQHPLKMANFPIAAAMFLRGDVTAAKKCVAYELSTEKELENLRKAGRAWRVVSPELLNISSETSLIHRICLLTGNNPAEIDSTSAPQLKDKQKFVSDTEEIIWDLTHDGKGVVTINSDRTKAVIGFIDGREFSLGEVTIIPGKTIQDWCTVGLTLLEGDSFKGPGRALLVATGYAENTNMKWKSPEKNSVGRNWGEAPSLIEVVPLEIIIPVPSEKLKVWALDELGQRKEVIDTKVKDGQAVIQAGYPQKTLWYEIILNGEG